MDNQSAGRKSLHPSLLCRLSPQNKCEAEESSKSSGFTVSFQILPVCFCADSFVFTATPWFSSRSEVRADIWRRHVVSTAPPRHKYSPCILLKGSLTLMSNHGVMKTTGIQHVSSSFTPVRLEQGGLESLHFYIKLRIRVFFPRHQFQNSDFNPRICNSSNISMRLK